MIAVVSFQSILFSYLCLQLLVFMLRIRQTEPNDPCPNYLISQKRYFKIYSLSISTPSFTDVIIYNNDQMRKLNLTFPDQIIEELSLFLLNRPKICKKQTRMGWSSNDRILSVRDNYLEYYNIHPGFQEENPASLKAKYFKGAVRLDFLHQVSYLPKNKPKKTQLEIVFPQKKKRLQPKEQLKQNEPQEDEQQKKDGEQVLQKWIFEFTFDLIDHIQKRKQQAKEQRRLLAQIASITPQQIFSPTQFKKTIKIQQDLNLITPKSKTNANNFEATDYEQNIEQYIQTIQKTKNILKSKAQMAEQQKNRQMKKKEKEIQQMKNSKNKDIQEKFSISSFWREYFKHFEIVLKTDHKSDKVYKMDRQIQLLRQVQSFNSIAKGIVQNYIDQLVSGFDEATKAFQGFRCYQGLWLKVGGKELNQQFLTNYNINDVLFTLKDIKGFKIRLPLMSLFKYKGFKVLVMCDMPFSELEKTEVYNLSLQEGDMLLVGKLKDCLETIEDILNVRGEPFEVEPKKKIVAPLGPHLKIYEYSFKKDKTQDQITLPNFYYLTNIGMIFPVNYKFQRDQPDYLARLRPEIVAFFRDSCKDENTQLLSQAFMDSTLPQENKRAEDQKAIQASKLIESFWIPRLVDQLNDCELMFTDSYSINSIMHEMGINIRYLWQIYEGVGLPYVRQILLAQALARTIKKQFRQALSDLSQQTGVKQNRESGQSGKDRLQHIGNRKIQYINKYKALAIDYLNLVFGQGEETIQFWKIIVLKCSKYFKIQATFPPQVKPGCLLNAVLWHCGLSLVFEQNVPLFRSATPFNQENEVRYETRMRTFDYPSFEIQKLFRSAPSISDNINFELFKQSNPKLLKMELLFGKTIGNSWTFNTTLAKLNNYQQFLQKPSVRNNLHPIHIPYYISNKSVHNFKTGISILNFSLPETHPLLISFYIEYSDLLDTELIKKTALLLSIKCFGEYHAKTTEIYSKYYHEGYQEYKEQAKRMKDIHACQVISREYYNNCEYQSCLTYCIDQVNKMKDRKGSQKLGPGNYQVYLSMLLQGLESAVKTLSYDRGIFLSESISQVVSSFKYKDRAFTQNFYRQTLIIHLLKCKKKYFLYKMVLFVVHIRTSHQKVSYDQNNLVCPCDQPQRNRIVDGLTSEYYEHGNHSNWIAYIISTIIKSFQYFNFLEDLFNRYADHLKRYNSDEFKTCIGYFDLLVRLYGQQFFKQTLYDVRFN